MFAALTHDRVPDTGPLPDLVLDAVRYQGWGLAGCEYLLLLTTGLAMLVVALHSHRTVILRRVWLLLGLLYYYRALTMLLTVLPKAHHNTTGPADQTLTCANLPQLVGCPGIVTGAVG